MSQMTGIPSVLRMNNIHIHTHIYIYFINLFIYFWLLWVFVTVRGLSLVAETRGYSLLRCGGFSLLWLLLLWSSGSKYTGSVVVACGL